MSLAFAAAPATAAPGIAAPRLRRAAPGAAAPEAGAAFAGGVASVGLGAAAIAVGSSVVTRRAAAVKKKGVKVVQQLDGREIPWNLFMPKAPYQGTVIKNDVQAHTITKPNSSAPGDANWETTHVTFDHGGKVPYVEGQSIGVIAPGPDKKGETPAKIRLYSIGSSAVGDCQDSKTVSLCVKRVVEVEEEKWPLKHSNREVGEDKPDKAGTCFPDAKVYRGVCSNHICDMSEGDEVLITGPTGAEMLLPNEQDSISSCSRRAPASHRCAPTCACSSTTRSEPTPTGPGSSRAWRGSSLASRTRTRCSTSTSTTSTRIPRPVPRRLRGVARAEERRRPEDVHPDEDGRVRRGPALGADAVAEDAHLHVRPEGHGVRHGGVFLASGGEGGRGLEGLREGDEEGPPLPRGGVLSPEAHVARPSETSPKVDADADVSFLLCNGEGRPVKTNLSAGGTVCLQCCPSSPCVAPLSDRARCPWCFCCPCFIRRLAGAPAHRAEDEGIEEEEEELLRGPMPPSQTKAAPLAPPQRARRQGGGLVAWALEGLVDGTRTP
ncbi:unnamed protein product [Prorocentrum cordatum]|uniref:ferredoxin--NADP(+) reductase n=1 Tax=Prorocentrum cordatum TaxID=2364126 RepID=A0ABN9UIX8_9DINO|nr:unnamed protein product [Polarella glacialis]